jgi:hypothetical protein
MKASALIQLLESLVKEYGDVTVMTMSLDTGELEPVSDIEVSDSRGNLQIIT